VLKTFPDNSIDSVVTDPPYGLGKEPNAIEVLQSWITTGYHEVKGKGFMGKEWDAFVPQPLFWKEIYRVLKPGGYVLSFAGTRTYDWMVMAVRLAGFEVRDMIAWLYGSGFPKSHDISKAIDKMLGAEREVIGKAKGVGSNNTNSMKSGLGGKQEFSNEYDITEPSTEEAKQWQGWGTALKPALEPIVMARKPVDGTVAQNVLKHGVGGINIDESRIETDEKTQRENKGIEWGNRKNEYYEDREPKIFGSSLGRFPANVIHDGSDEVVSLFPSVGEGNGDPYNYSGITYNNKDTSMFNGDKPQAPSNYNDSGSASRFFYCAKASKEERNFGLYDFEEKYTASAEFRPNHMKKALEGEDGNPYGRWQPRKNIHPTVKPIDLMRYLVRLVTPPNGICLDPYLGSGTTAIACEMEKFRWIGIELVPEYAEIAKARIGAVKDYEATLDTKTIITESIKEDKEKELGIMNIFDFMEEK
jgi:site-specific DNA-methyltransferase (adenine-specific)